MYMRIVRAIIAVLVAIGVYLLSRSATGSLLEDWTNETALILLGFIVGVGLPFFLAFVVASLITPREYRFILVGVLLYALYAWQIIGFFPLTPGFWPFVGSLIRLSFAALGAYLAIALTANVGEAKYPKKTGEVKYSIPVFLTGMALVSIPIIYVVLVLSFFIALGVSAWLMLIVFQLPRVPVVLILAIGLAPLVTGWAAIKGLAILFKRPVPAIPALSVDTEQTPTLRRVVGEVCTEVQTDAPDSIVLSAEPGFFVTQSTLKTLDEKTCSGRILSIGAPLLYELDGGELKSVFAHEFAHFTGKDTVYSRTVLPVHRTISSVFQNLQVGGSGSWTEVLINILLIIPRYCIMTFVNYFGSIDSLLSRRRELRADRIAAESYGDQNFISALTKVTHSSLYYYRNVYNKIDQMHPEGNLFHHVHRQMGDRCEEIDELVEKEKSRKEDVFDSHPSLGTRIENLPEVEKDTTNHSSIEQILKELNPLLDDLSARCLPAPGDKEEI
jgi:Zn-dependent protease with chaperone function